MLEEEYEKTRRRLPAHLRRVEAERPFSYEIRPVRASDIPDIREIYNQFLWLLYCDLREHRLIGADKLSQTQRDTAARCVLFLKSGLPYLWPVLSRGRSALLTVGNLLTFGLAGRMYFRRLSSAGDMSYWPFLDQSQYAAALGAPVYLSGAGANSSFKPMPLRGTA